MIWVNNMKTTIDIVDPLFKEAKRLSKTSGLTFREIVEHGLRMFIASQKKAPRESFKMRRLAFTGNGIRPELDEGDWSKIIGLSYGDRL